MFVSASCKNKKQRKGRTAGAATVGGKRKRVVKRKKPVNKGKKGKKQEIKRKRNAKTTKA